MLANAQPCCANYPRGPLAIAHNGNLTNALELSSASWWSAGAIFTTSSDTEVLVHLIARSEADTVEGQIRDALEQVDGAYSLRDLGRDVPSTPSSISRGFRPLVLGPPRRRHGRRVGDLRTRPGRRHTGLRASAGRVRPHRGWQGHRAAPPQSATGDAAASSSWCTSPGRTAPSSASRWIGSAASSAGSSRGSNPHPGAEVVFSVPDSSNAMALGFSEVSGIKLEYGLIRNHYVGRTFINPTQALRVAKVKIKFNPVRDVIEGKSVVVVDDSLVRGTTSKGLVQMIRAAGAREVHLRLASPPITGPCHYGIDTPTREELIAATHSIEEIREFLGVDYARLSRRCDGMLHAAGDDQRVCHACFSGSYPTPIPGRSGTAAARRAPGRDAGMTGPYAQPLVYFFGQGRADGTAAMKDVLGGKGAGLAEMTNSRDSGPARIHHREHHLPDLPRDAAVPPAPPAAGRDTLCSGSRPRPASTSAMQTTRCSSRCAPAPPSRCPGMMETILNLGLNDDTVEGLTRQSGNPQFAWDSLPALRPDVRRGGVRSAQEAVRADARGAHVSSCKVARDIDLPVPSMQALVRRLQGAHQERDRPGLSRASDGPALGRHRRGLRELEHPARDRLPEAARHPRHDGHRGQRRHHGVRQPGRGLGHRRRVHPRPVDRRAGALRRVPAQCPGRGCGLRARGHRSRSRRSRSGCRSRIAELERIARTLERHFRDVQDMEFTIERGTALHAADAARPALRPGRGARSPARWWTRS